MRVEVKCWIVALFGVVIHFSSVVTVPTQKIHKCAAYCKENERTNIYSPGSSYVYSYTAESDTFINGIEGNNEISRLRITAVATIHVAAPCEYILQIQNTFKQFINGL
ncbi:uncharacterized protein LOC113375611 [Ctenocephalides felis]|uniref:uncharacterized protein LOC113375611 n=1 Tax=Ctenocephalides felis TaxID=7515 RepID=UPI000E6E1A4E|nr:uncharacterized protein LOC113375611 [Ctenocephalides felis]